MTDARVSDGPAVADVEAGQGLSCAKLGGPELGQS